ncbi:kinase-like protein [Rhizophagus irregularis]|uniref:Kinase-like protein n=1 Tax=Rhizophagus irregularis TaxID=588596 RepID=A0A2I1GJB1_9GLOM|nr:kinase-like protein [Rhizophagus irregularis]
MNLGFNGSMIPEYKNTKYYQHSRARIPSSQSQSSYTPRQTSTNHPRSVSERYSRSTTSSLHDNSSLKNESIKSFSYYHKKIRSWDEREVINDEILQLQKHSSELCPECRKLFNEKKWCRPCNAEHFRRQIPKWTSWSPDLDNFITKTQVTANNVHSFFEWIPFMNFDNIKYLAKGGCNVVYKAIWKQGPIICWDTNINNWKRLGNYEVVLKVIKGSQKNLNEFINMLIVHHKFHTIVGHILRCFGISRWEGSGDFIVVTSYANYGNLRQYIYQNFENFSWIERLITLKDIAMGLEIIHNSGYVHRDLHIGNILRHKNRTMISDFGLTWRQGSGGKLYGVLPYMAPEILSGGQYSFASDIYSFGIIMYEIASGKIPFYHEDINPNIIIQGSRPGRPHSTPVVYIQLMESCWDSDPRKRPTANYLISMLDDWIHSKRKHLVIIYNSFQHAENERKNPELTKIDQISINQTNQSISNSQLNSNISPTAATPRKKQKSILIRILVKLKIIKPKS